MPNCPKGKQNTPPPRFEIPGSVTELWIFHWVNEWRFNIFHECWTMFIVFHKKKTPSNMFILFIFYAHAGRFWKWEKKTKFTANELVYHLSNAPCTFVTNNFNILIWWFNIIFFSFPLLESRIEPTNINNLHKRPSRLHTYTSLFIFRYLAFFIDRNLTMWFVCLT